MAVWLVTRDWRSRLGVVALAAGALIGLGGAATSDFGSGQAAFERHLARALDGVPTASRPRIESLCRDEDDLHSAPAGVLMPRPRIDLAESALPPMKVMDNLYFIGDRSLSVWAVTTSAGIIVFEATEAARVQDRVVHGLRTLGLDPADIRYVFVSHAHDDHYGGAAYLQATFGAHAIMGKADWALKPDPNRKGIRDPLPRRDVVIDHDQALTLGDETITIVQTPGHTPGDLSVLIPVKDGGRPHVAALFGGGFPYGSLGAVRNGANSALRFENAARDAGADILIYKHPLSDGSLGYMEALRHRAPGQPNPFVIGPDAVAKWIDINSRMHPCLLCALCPR